ncbi:MAG: Rieske 2Fe-2S domain-containing protein [Acidobacteriota bacterium]
MEVTILKRSFLQRLFGLPVTQPPQDPHCWRYEGGEVVVDLSRAPEITRRGGGIRLEGKGLPDRVLVIHGEDGRYHAFRNRCGHMGRRLDPVPGTETVQCCSVGKTTYDYGGKALHGPAKKPAGCHAVQVEDGRIRISLR